MKERESIIDEILYEERLYRTENHTRPTILNITTDAYDDLVEEMGVGDLDTFHGMEIIITDDLDDDFELDGINFGDEDFVE